MRRLELDTSLSLSLSRPLPISGNCHAMAREAESTILTHQAIVWLRRIRGLDQVFYEQGAEGEFFLA